MLCFFVSINDIINKVCVNQQLTVLPVSDIDCVEEHETAWTSANAAFKPTACAQS